MINSLKRLIKVSKIFTKHFGWTNERVSKAMMRDLFLSIEEYFEKQIKKEYDPTLSRRLDLIQAILDTYND